MMKILSIGLLFICGEKYSPFGACKDDCEEFEAVAVPADEIERES